MKIIDIHTHILPNMDDGAKSLEMSLSMIESLKSDGVGKIYFTPHFYSTEESIDDFIKRREYSYNSLQPYLDRDIVFCLGAEVYLTKYLFSPSNSNKLQLLKMGDGNTMLVELSHSKIEFFEILEWINKIKLAGFIPIIAHIERYFGIDKYWELVKSLNECGVLFQINAQSLIDKKYYRIIKKFFKKYKVSFVASDVHDMHNRPPKLAFASEIVKQFEAK